MTVWVAGAMVEAGGRGQDRLVRRRPDGSVQTEPCIIHPMLLEWRLGA